MAEIKAKMAVDGAAKFRSDMRDAKNVVKELDSELKLADSQFKATGNAEELMQTKTETLKKQIEAQEKVVGLLKDQLGETEKKYGSNSSEVTKLKTELNKAKTKQNDMKKALKDTEQPMESLTTDTGELKDETGEAADNAGELKDNLESIAKIDSLSVVSDIAKGVSGAIETAAQKAKDLGVAVWNLGGSAGQTADNWKTLSDQTGFSVEEIQKFEYAGRFVDTTLDNITGSMVKFKTATKDNKGLRQFAKEVGKTQKELQKMDPNDRYWLAVDYVSSLYKSGDINKAEAASMEWFGRSAANMNPLLKAGREAFEALGEEAENMGYILSEEQVDNLGTFDDKMQQLEKSVEALKLSLAEQLLPALEPVADALKKVSDELLGYLATEEGQAAIKKITDAFGQLADNLADQIPTAITSATELVSNFADAFSDADSAANILKTTIFTLGAVWAGTKLVAFGTDLLKAGAALKQLFPSVFGGGTPTTPTTPTVTPPVTPTTPATGPATGATGTGFWASVGKVLTKPGTKAVGGAAVGLYTFLEPLIGQIKEGNKREAEIKADSEDTSIIEAARKIGDTLADAQETIESYMIDFGMGYEDAKEAYTEGKTYEDVVKENTVDFRREMTPEEERRAEELRYYNSLEHSTDDYADALKRLDAALVSVGEGEGTFWLEESVNELKGLDIGHIFSDDVIEGLQNFDEIAPEDFAGWTQSLRDQLAVAAGEAGAEVPTSLASGMQETEMEPWEEMELIDDGIEEEAASLKPTMTIVGYNGGIGFVNGLKGTKKKAKEAGKEVAESAKDGMKEELDVNSPSRVMMQIGRFASEGFAIGMEDGIGTVMDAVSKVYGALGGTPVYGGTGSAQAPIATDAVVAALNGAQVVMDGETVGRLIFPRINAEMGRVQQRRYA